MPTQKTLYKALQKINAVYVLIFKTTIRFKKDVKNIAPILDAEHSVIKWNVDRSDVDHILRVESFNNNINHIIKLMNTAGYDCEELTD
ncbi:MAG: hypothetical protein JST87_03025 [Bacteroidetes bacterium]|nr:hypothetical protein [Bacteroidota bacterium]MBS1933443.1 hypothetical protein [Bacteroidota bacterium]